jgi:hypothetical protein
VAALMPNLMRKLLTYLFWLIMTACVATDKHLDGQGEHPQLNCHRIFTSEELSVDFLMLTTKLQEIHPDLYRVTPKPLLEKRINHIQRNIESPKTYLQFLKLLAPLFTDIGDINTQWGHSPDYIKYRNEKIPIFPFQLLIQDEKFYIRANYSEDTSIVSGSELLKINGESVTKYLKKNYSLLPTDGKIKSIQHRWLESYFPQHHSNFWAQPDTFQLELKNKTGKIYFRNIRALLKKEIQLKKNSSNIVEASADFNIIDSIGVLTIPSFNEGKLESFVDSCFNVIKNKRIDNLILNLKGQGYGNHYFGSVLYSYLKPIPSPYADQIYIKGDSSFKYVESNTSYESIEKLSILLKSVTSPKRNSFNGNLYIITDGWSIGSKGFFCAKVQGRANTFFVGEECGSSTFGINDFPTSLILPNTGLQISIPTVQMQIKNEKKHSLISGVKVDFPIKEIEVDKVIKQTLELVKRMNK